MEENIIRYDNCNSSECDNILMSEDSVRKRIKSIHNSFFDANNIFSKFPIDKFNKENQEKLIIHIFWTIQDGSDREIMSKIKDLNVNVNLEKWYCNNNESIEGVSEIYKVKNRNIIKNYNLKSDECISYLIDNMNNIKNYRILIEVSLDTYIQLLTHRLYTMDIYKAKEIKNITNKLLKLHLKLVKEIINKTSKIEENNIERAFDKYLDYLEITIFEKNYIEIMKCLVHEMEENKEKYSSVKNIYKTKKNELVLGRNIKNVLCEGNHVEQFDLKLEETKRMIEIFNKYGMRNCSVESIQDLKVYFREFYLDNTKYTKRANQSMTIIRKYLEELSYKDIDVKEFENIKDYIFIREKISRGYYREIGKNQEYILRSNMYEKAYELYSQLFLLYDNKEILKMCNKINKELFKRVSELLIY